MTKRKKAEDAEGLVLTDEDSADLEQALQTFPSARILEDVRAAVLARSTVEQRKRLPQCFANANALADADGPSAALDAVTSVLAGLLFAGNNKPLMKMLLNSLYSSAPNTITAPLYHSHVRRRLLHSKSHRPLAFARVIHAMTFEQGSLAALVADAGEIVQHLATEIERHADAMQANGTPTASPDDVTCALSATHVVANRAGPALPRNVALALRHASLRIVKRPESYGVDTCAMGALGLAVTMAHPQDVPDDTVARRLAGFARLAEPLAGEDPPPELGLFAQLCVLRAVCVTAPSSAGLVRIFPDRQADDSDTVCLMHLILDRSIETMGNTGIAADASARFYASGIIHNALNRLRDLPESEMPILSRQREHAILETALAHINDAQVSTQKNMLAVLELAIDLELDFIESTEYVKGKTQGAAGGTGAFTEEVIARVLSVDSASKARYPPLAMLAKKVGVQCLLARRPCLLRECFEDAMSDRSTCSACVPLLRSLFEEFSALTTNESESAIQTRAWVAPLVKALSSRDAVVRANAASFALPAALGADPATALVLVAETRPQADTVGEEMGIALIAVLSCARKHGLLEDGAIMGRLRLSNRIKGYETASVSSEHVPVGLLSTMLQHRSMLLHHALVDVLLLDSRTSHVPDELEMSLLRDALRRSLRGGGSHSRHRYTTVVAKFIERLKLGADAARATLTIPGRLRVLRKQAKGKEQVIPTPDPAQTVYGTYRRAAGHLGWLCRLLEDSIYPGSPSHRAFLAVDSLLHMTGQMAAASGVETAQPLGLREACGKPPSLGATVSTDDISPCDPFPRSGPAAADLSTDVIAAAAHPFERVRMASTSMLVALNTPATDLSAQPDAVPGLSTKEHVQPWLIWAVRLSCTPRVRDADAGARVLRTLAQLLASLRGWKLTIFPMIDAIPPPEGCTGSTLDGFIDSVIAALESEASLAQSDILGACKRSMGQGLLILIRHLLDDVPFKALLRNDAAVAAWQKRLIRIFAATERILAASHDMLIGAPERNGSEDVNTIGALDGSAEASLGTTEMVWGRGDSDLRDEDVPRLPEVSGEGGWPDDSAFEEFLESEAAPSVHAEILDELNRASHASVAFEGTNPSSNSTCDTLAWQAMDSTFDDSIVASNAQLLSTGCWNSAKEVGILHGKLVHRMPLQILRPEQIVGIGSSLLEAILTIKHRGVVDNMQSALTQVSARLLAETGAEAVDVANRRSVLLRDVPSVWLESIVARMAAKDQTKDDIVRRSAGFPYAVAALLLSERHDGSSPSRLASWAFPQLLDLAKMSKDAQMVIQNGDGSLSVIEAHRVHALNVLTRIFNQSELVQVAHRHVVQGVDMALAAFSSESWDVRNGAGQCFAALLGRICGMKNVKHRTTAASAHFLGDMDERDDRSEDADPSFRREQFTLRDLHARYPMLVELLRDRLQSAIEALDRGILTPSLPPLLALLGRLRPEPPGSASTAHADVEALAASMRSLVRQAAADARHHVRAMAARAFPALVGGGATALADAIAQAANDLTSLSSCHSLSSNALHGAVLTFWRLLDAAMRRALSSPSPRGLLLASHDATLAALNAFCRGANGLFDAPLFPPMLRADALQAASRALELYHLLARADIDASKKMAPIAAKAVVLLASACSSIAATPVNEDQGQAAEARLRECAVEALLHRCRPALAFLRDEIDPSSLPAFPTIQMLLASPFTGVRAIAARAWQTRTHRATAYPKVKHDLALTAAEFDAALTHALLHERDARVRWRLLHVASDAASADPSSLTAHANALVRIAHGKAYALGGGMVPGPSCKPHRREREMATLALAHFVGGAAPAPQEVVNAFAAAVDFLSLPGQSSDSRVAAAMALSAASSLLCTALAGPHTLQLWAAARRLLADEDSQARAAAARGVGTALGRPDAQPVALHDALMMHVSDNIGVGAEGTAFLLSAILPLPTGGMVQNSDAEDGARLFETESDNQYDEPLLAAMLAARELRKRAERAAEDPEYCTRTSLGGLVGLAERCAAEALVDAPALGSAAVPPRIDAPFFVASRAVLLAFAAAPLGPGLGDAARGALASIAKLPWLAGGLRRAAEVVLDGGEDGVLFLLA